MTEPVWSLWLVSLAGAVSLSAQEDCPFDAASAFWNCSSKALAAVPPGAGGDLLELDLSFNRIERVRAADLKSAVNLQTLLLQSNQIQTIEEEAFHSLVRLERLDLSRNNLTLLSPSWFRSLASLKKLNIKGNRYLELGERPLFSSLQELRFLSVGNDNGFSTFRKRDLEGISFLEELEIEGHNLKQYEQGSLQSVRLLNYLILSGLSTDILSLFIYDIRKSVVCLELRNMKQLNMAHFHFPDQAISIAVQKFVLRNVELSDSSVVQTIGFLANMGHLHELEILDSRHQGVGEFYDMPHISSNIQVLTIRNMSNDQFYAFSDLYTAMSLVKNITKLTAENAKVYLIPCVFAKSFHSLQYLDLSVNLLMDTALDHSLCEGAWPKLQTLNVSQNSLKQIQVVAGSAARLANLSSLDISQNNFEAMPDSCVWPAHLRYLNLSSSKIDRITRCIPPSLEVLDVSSNNLQEFRLSLPHLQELYIQSNKLAALPGASFIPRARVISIQGNRVFGFSEQQLEDFSNLETLDARDNSFQCTCEFLAFIRSQARVSQLCVGWPRDYLCDGPEYIRGKEVGVAQLQLADCHFASVVALICISLLVVFLVVALLCYKLHAIWYVKMIWAWLQAKHKPQRVCSKEICYDAFVSYSERDSEWVENVMVPELEHASPPFRLCLHKRDFTPGKWIVDNIIDSMEKSSKTLFVLSEHFVQSEWCKYELDFSHFRLFDENNDAVILILLEPISSHTLPKRFCKLRKLMNTKTYLEWPRDEEEEPVFWFNLKTAIKS
ncbi:toll-like receptor 2 type-2 [Pogona vitticeps]